MRQSKIDQLYRQHERHLFERANTIALMTGRFAPDLISEGREIFMTRIIPTYDEDRASFSTWFHRILTQQLLKRSDPAMNPGAIEPEEILAPLPAGKSTEEKDLHLSYLLEDLSEEARKVVDLVLDLPMEIFGVKDRGSIPGNVWGAKKWIWNRLREQGYSVPKLRRIFRELKSTFSQT